MGKAAERLVKLVDAREDNILTNCLAVDVMPIATEMAGVDMRLEAGAIRYTIDCSKHLLLLTYGYQGATLA